MFHGWQPLTIPNLPPPQRSAVSCKARRCGPGRRPKWRLGSLRQAGGTMKTRMVYDIALPTLYITIYQDL